MQPTYLPWMGYFDLIDQVDTFVFLDSVQLTRRSWQVRNRIKTSQGELLLTIPIKKISSRDETLICDVEIDDSQKWRENHIKSIELSYKKTKFFLDFFPVIKELVLNPTPKLADFNIQTIQALSKLIGLNKEFVRTSNISGLNGNKDELLSNICLKLNCREYLSPLASADYIEKDTPGGHFTPHNIKLQYHNYTHPIYPQMHDNFISHMGIIDLIFNIGNEESLKIIRSGRQGNKLSSC